MLQSWKRKALNITELKAFEVSGNIVEIFWDRKFYKFNDITTFCSLTYLTGLVFPNYQKNLGKFWDRTSCFRFCKIWVSNSVHISYFEPILLYHSHLCTQSATVWYVSSNGTYMGQVRDSSYLVEKKIWTEIWDSYLVNLHFLIVL